MRNKINPSTLTKYNDYTQFFLLVFPPKFCIECRNFQCITRLSAGRNVEATERRDEMIVLSFKMVILSQIIYQNRLQHTTQLSKSYSTNYRYY